MVKKDKDKKKSDWDLESPFDQAATLEELIEAPPFKGASDEHGDSVTAGTRVPRWLFRRVVKLVEIRGTPYELTSDVLRDAVYIGLRVLHMRHKLSPDWSIETKLASVVSDTGVMQRIRAQTKELIIAIEDLCASGEEGRAIEQLTKYVSTAIELEDKFHKKRLFKMLDENRTIRDLIRNCDPNVQNMVKDWSR